MRTMIRVLLMIGLMCLLPQPLIAATRLGLQVTQEELNIWRARRTDNANTINGKTYQFIWTNRIAADATFFDGQSHPGGDGFYTGYDGAGCAPQSVAGGMVFPAPRNGQYLLRAAFAYMIDPTTYANAGADVATELLNQITDTGTNFGNTSKWCVSSFSGEHGFKTVPWLLQLLFAFQYLDVGGYSWQGSQHADLLTWFQNAATWVNAGSAQIVACCSSYQNMYSNNFTCTGGAGPCDTSTPINNPTNSAGLPYFGGTSIQQGTYYSFFNQTRAPHTFLMAAGILFNNTTWMDHAKLYFEGVFRRGTWQDGSHPDFMRWGDCSPLACPGSMWGHAALMTLIEIADLLARTGDTSLYTLSVPAQMIGANGASVSLLTSLELWSSLVNGTVIKYGTQNSSQQTNDYKLNWNTGTPPGASGTEARYGHLSLMVANVFYQSSTIHSATSHNFILGHGDTSQDCSDNQVGGCFSEQMYPDIPYMFGNLDSNQINPYSIGADTLAPKPPTGLSVTGIYPTQIQATWTPPTQNTDNSSLTDLAGYVMKYCLTAACTPNLVLPNIGLVSTIVLTGLTPSTTYYLTLEAVDTSNNHSTPTAIASVATPAQGLIVHYPLNQSSGTTATDIIAGRNGTLCNGAAGCGTQGPSWVAGHVGSNALSFDGVASPNNDFVRVADHASLNFLANQDFTVAWWINTTQAATAGVWPDVIAKGDATAGWGIELHEENVDPKWHVNVRVASTVYPTNGCTNVASAGWKHLAFTRQGTSIRTYEDGVLCQTTTNAALNGSLTNSNAFYWAVDSSETGTPFAGSLDDIRLYNFALDSNQIGALFSGQATLATTHWRFHGYGQAENTEWLASEDQARAIRQDGKIRLRYGIQNTSVLSTQGYPLQCKQDNGPYQTVTLTGGTSTIILTDDPLVTDGQGGTQQLTVPGGTTFAQSVFVESATTPTITLTTNTVGEVEYPLQIIQISQGVVVCCHPVQGDLSAVAAGASGDACLTVNAGSFSLGF